ncbi:N-acyl homoserine lactonase [Lasiodiplodia theobromae]|uniref:N-acyl homoserine lactonase n=1 Tax=Lasiodiplodia theobromae TaxID=45133 RepID=UPI0015C3B3E8|nr:N-acyl homoserine lactonase [Lasiodiplodia theobromae]KAF4546697.1 N-acyl homoserine lactonase [Lasiodiplodia theobromae]
MARDNGDGGGEFLAMPKAPPNLNIPPSGSTVSVSVIDTGVRVSLPIAPFLEPQIRGKDRMTGPAYSFLITHNQSGRRLLFDLSVRKDCRTGFAPAVQQRVNDPAKEFWVRWIDPFSSSSSPKWEADTEPEAEPRDVVDVLAAGGLRPDAIEAVVWSHHHWDHTGDLTRFPAASTKLVVGPGFTQAFGAGWPAVEGAPVKGEEWAGRELVEVGFDEEDGLKIGRFRAKDWWGDGSFYLLDTPGHAVGHLCGLARDCAHHGAEFRPSPYLPLPRTISPSPFPHHPQHATICPGALFAPIHPAASLPEKATKPFYTPTQFFPYSFDDCVWSIDGLQEFDADERVFVVNAHDESLLSVFYGVDGEGKGKGLLWPQGTLDAWREGQNLATRARWAFLEDFAGAVGLGERGK